MSTDLLAAVEAFFDTEILPRHREWVAHVSTHRGTPPFMAGLKEKARAAGLWNLGLPDRMSNRAYAPIARSPAVSRGRRKSSMPRRPTFPT